jgi:hypothetical protein
MKTRFGKYVPIEEAELQDENYACAGFSSISQSKEALSIDRNERRMVIHEDAVKVLPPRRTLTPSSDSSFRS